MLKYCILLSATGLFISSTSRSQSLSGENINELTAGEIKSGWVLLFDGKTGTGWRSAGQESFPEKGWLIEDGILTVSGGKGGHIITEKKYGDFDLHIEYRVKEQRANSGIKYYVLEDGYQEGKTLGLEFQIANVRPGTNLKTSPGSLYDILPPKEKSVHLSPPGEWNQVRIVSKNGRVQHWLNGYKVLQYQRGGKKFREGISNSKFKDIKNFGEVSKGHILLQDHNHDVSFRNIKIREL